ncbi:MAG: alpha-amylase family glycosyl hydrolase [Chloroflexota bacterium]|nr:alpha-amylase family glycosyl hydrolase [Chloroflexota bacterium]
MASWRNKPFIYQINTRVWLTTLSETYGYTITLDNIPDEVLDDVSKPGIDIIWFMGIWQRGEKGRANALKYKHEYRGALPDITDADVIGSAYAIADYRVEDSIGGRAALARLRERLRQRGVKIMLDYVPNHVGLDHEWAKQPEFVITGTKDQQKARPDVFFKAKRFDGKDWIIAHGRDPYFPGWEDTVQLNVFHPTVRQAVVFTLLDIASQCDGVRCDMAMLMMNDIFAGTWAGCNIGPRPQRDYWQEIVPQVRAQYPDFMFIAEVYWDKEYDIIQQGFDYAYDKTLYDRIGSGDVQKLRQHLLADIDYQKHLIRFIENHDEHRAFAHLGEERSLPAATLICTLPGAVLLHDGQFLGRTVKLPVQIGRQPDEELHPELEEYYRRLLWETLDPSYERGQFYLFEVWQTSPEDHSNRNLLAYGWRDAVSKRYRLIVVNLTGEHSYGRINLGYWSELARQKRWKLFDVTDGVEYVRHGGELTHEGLFIYLEPYESHIFRFELDIEYERPVIQHARVKA